ncbi:MAG: S9 family peptidase [Sinobacteraceae bacterium]|nr:S9 family peptidase [Nevskiaceae bacterium]
MEILRPAAAGLIVFVSIATGTDARAARAFTPQDLVMMARVSDPQVAPDGSRVAFTVRETDFDANKGVNGIWLLALRDKDARPVRLTAQGESSDTPRWSPDGRALFFLSTRSGSSQVWRLDLGGGEARQVTRFPLDINNFRVAPDGRHLLLSIDVYTDCTDFACTKKRLDEATAAKADGRLYHRLFIRHWDTWSDGRRSQLFIVPLDADGTADGEPRWLTRGIDGDIPSKPFGDDAEYHFSPDGKTVYFDVRIAGLDEPWSTNFDIYAVPADGSAPPRNLTAANPAWDADPLPSPDGRKLYYRAMKRPGFESDRFGIMELDLTNGKTRELDPDWDRSAGTLRLSADGRTIYTTADDLGEHPLFALDIKTGKIKELAGGGDVAGFSVSGERLVIARSTLSAPADLYEISTRGGAERMLTAFNAARLSELAFGAVERFTFPGWNGDTVHGYVVQPYGFQPGRKYPMAFFIHGGPQGSWLDEFHYRWNPQVFAGAGYAVVAIDFHGSTGYGQAFTDAISGHWGDRPLEDLQKGYAAALAEFPWLDADRACALGASYGGYMIDWIAGVWNAPWKCLVVHDGVFDTRMMYYATDELWFEEWENRGLPWEKPENYERFNPTLHVGDWHVPMLVVHSSKDFRIPLSQGIAAFTALQRRGIPSEFLTFPDESHFVQKPQNSLQWHQTVLAWLKRWTGETE